jgi:hypothetical protein
VTTKEKATDIARLQERIRILEKALKRRSRELREFQRLLCPRDLVLLDRIQAGLPPVIQGPFEPYTWEETTELTPADVDDVMNRLWKSVLPEDDEL